MLTALQLREKRAANVVAMRKILDTAETAKRAISGEEQQEYSRLDKEVDELKVEIEKRERLGKLEDELKAPEQRNAGGSNAGGIGHQDREIEVAGGDDKTKKAQTELRNRAFRKYMRSGAASLETAEQKALELRATGEASITGYGVSDGFQVSLFDNLKYWSGVEQAPVSYKRTTSGNQYPMLVVDDTSNTGTLLTENTTMASNADATYTQVTLGAYMFTSKAILVSMQALQDIEALEDDVVKNASIRIGRIRGSYFTTGTGTNQPQGIVTAATAAGLSVVGAIGQTTTLIADNLIDLEHQLDPAYRLQSDKGGKKLCGYMLHDSTVQAIKKLKDGYGRYLWLPGLAAADPDTINGFPYYVNNFMPTMAANAKSIVFGYWPAYTIRDVAEPIFLRLDQRYADSLQVGFIAAVRSDARVAQTNAFAYYANSAT